MSEFGAKPTQSHFFSFCIMSRLLIVKSIYGFVMLVDAKPDRVHAVHPRVATTNVFFFKLSTYLPILDRYTYVQCAKERCGKKFNK